MNSVLIHRLFGFILATVGVMIAVTGFMFWIKPPDAPLHAAALISMILFGLVVFAGGIGVVRQSSIARLTMIAAAGLVICTLAVGVIRAALAANIGEIVILLTAVMPAVLVVAVLYELGRDESTDDQLPD